MSYNNNQIFRSILSGVQRLRGSVGLKNAASSIVALIWLGAMSIVTIPIYISTVGIQEWGVVAACASLQLLANFIDAGFSQIVPRWAAKEAKSADNLFRYFTLFRSIYLSLSILLLLTIQFGAFYLATDWFHVSPEKSYELEFGIRIVAFQLFFQLMNSLNIGFWNGLQFQVQANVRLCIFGTLKHILTISFLNVLSPKAWVYTMCFAMVAALEWLINYINLSHSLQPKNKQLLAEPLEVYPIIREVSVLSAGVLLGLFMSQLDRIVLSATVDLTLYGIYTILITLSMAVLQLQAPITRAYLPVLVQNLQSGSGEFLSIIQKMVAGTVVVCTLPAMLAVVFAHQILTHWINDVSIVGEGVLTLRLLLIAVAINSIYGCIYVIMLALGRADRIFQINFASVLVVSIVVFVVVPYKLGLTLGGVIWICTSLVQLTLGTIWLVFRKNAASLK